jgi:hypothetical protein
MSTTADEVRVQPADLSPEILALATTTSAGITVLPLDLVDQQGVYSESSLMIVKELRALGGDAEYAQPAAQRVFEVKKSAEGLLLAYVIGIASTATWDLMKRLLSRRKDARLSVTFVELEEGHDLHVTAWKVEGNGEAVVRAIDAIRDRSLPDGQANDGDSVD